MSTRKRAKPGTGKVSSQAESAATGPARREELTSSAIDWLDGTCESLAEQGADAESIADIAINATLDVLGCEDEDEDSFDREKIVEAAEGILAALEDEDQGETPAAG